MNTQLVIPNDENKNSKLNKKKNPNLGDYELRLQIVVIMRRLSPFTH